MIDNCFDNVSNNENLFDIVLAIIIGVKSIKNDLIKIYNVLSKRIAILYKQDENLQVTSYEGSYLAYANYKLLIQDYETILNTTFGPYKKSFDIDLTTLPSTISHNIDGIHLDGNDFKIETIILSISGDNVKKLVKNKKNCRQCLTK